MRMDGSGSRFGRLGGHQRLADQVDHFQRRLVPAADIAAPQPEATGEHGHLPEDLALPRRQQVIAPVHRRLQRLVILGLRPGTGKRGTCPPDGPRSP